MINSNSILWISNINNRTGDNEPLLDVLLRQLNKTIFENTVENMFVQITLKLEKLIIND